MVNSPPILEGLEDRVRQIGKELLAQARRCHTPWVRFKQQDWLLEKMMGRDDLRASAMRFVDVLPMLGESRNLASHLREYFSGVDIPMVPQRAKQFVLGAAQAGWLAPVASRLVHYGASKMARRFIAGQDVPSVTPSLQSLRQQGMAFTLDLLGEAVVSETESAGYHRLYLDLLEELAPIAAGQTADPLLDRISGRVAPRQNLSIKVSALYSQISPVDCEGCVARIKDRLRPILRAARRVGAFVTIDMEHYDTKHITLRVFQEILVEPEFSDWPDAGLALQAYLRDTPADLAALIAWVKRRGTPVMVRLVRGAYWDYETVHARQHGWPVPVWTSKPQTDVCYEQCLKLLLENYPSIETAIATHNIRSLACGIAMAERLGLTRGDYEIQMLYGMADEVKQAIVERGVRLRVYVPFGRLIPGMAYLVRRLLENTGSQSFLRMGFSENLNADELLALPKVTMDPVHKPHDARPMPNPPPLTNEPVRRFTDDKERGDFAAVLKKVEAEIGICFPLRLAGRDQQTAEQLRSVNPAKPRQVVGLCASATRQDAADAVSAALGAFPAWRDTPVTQRAGVLRKAAELMRRRRDELSAWEVLEAGKPWREADADVCEAIDFLEYYAAQAERMGAEQCMDVPGEANRYFYEPRGVGVVISPWNFPLAILCGMASAAIVTGNAVVIKPAPQTPVIAGFFERIMREAGLPDGVLNYLPGGDEAGDALVRDPRVKFIAFTGSVAVGTHIHHVASQLAEGQTHLKHVIAELGGKNAIIVDSDADPDEAVLGVVASAFGFAGQKCSACSRVIVVGELYETFLKRLAEAASSLRVGDPTDPGVVVGPVIDSEAFSRIRKAIEEARSYARPVLVPEVGTSGDGYFIGPTLFADAPPDSPLGQTEFFGPLLGVMKARDFSHALELANGTRYALTGGVYSRSPAHLELARKEFRVGNLYLNRKITGAVVGRHPFGGMKLSGTDAKAGGPDYLLHFVEARHVTENTIRRGFAPEAMS